jgi:hypothetical protein
MRSAGFSSPASIRASNQFNYSEVVGGATSLAIANAYYPDGRQFADNAGR